MCFPHVAYDYELLFFPHIIISYLIFRITPSHLGKFCKKKCVFLTHLYIVINQFLFIFQEITVKMTLYYRTDRGRMMKMFTRIIFFSSHKLNYKSRFHMQKQQFLKGLNRYHGQALNKKCGIRVYLYFFGQTELFVLKHSFMHYYQIQRKTKRYQSNCGEYALSSFLIQQLLLAY